MSTNRNQQENIYCELCGNDHGQCFEVRLGGERHVFDSFECAMRAFAPRCGHCGCELLDHGIVVGDSLYCSYECANDHTSENEQQLMLREQADL